MKFQHRNPSTILTSSIQLADVFGVLIAGYVAHYLKFQSFSLPTEYVTIIIVGGIVHLVASSQLYRTWRGGGIQSIYQRMFVSWVIVVNIIFTGYLPIYGYVIILHNCINEIGGKHFFKDDAETIGGI